MNIAVLGTGMVGESLATRLVSLEHEVMMGSRSADNEHAVKWVENNGDNAKHGTFADAAAFGEVVINATKGTESINALKAAGADNLKNKTLIDVSNIINQEGEGLARVGLPDGNSNAEEIQKAFPDAKVVKTLNTVNCMIMVNPRLIDKDQTVFLSGNDSEAKTQTFGLLMQMGWLEDQILDLGDITTARGPEMYLSLWLRIMQKLGNPNFNISVSR